MRRNPHRTKNPIHTDRKYKNNERPAMVRLLDCITKNAPKTHGRAAITPWQLQQRKEAIAQRNKEKGRLVWDSSQYGQYERRVHGELA